MRPCDLAGRALFAPISEWLTRCATNALPCCEQLNEWIGDGPCEALRPRRLRFVPPDDSPLGYEQRVNEHGEVITRARNWHDFFNALVWLRFPHIKTALNDAHLRHIERSGARGGRGPVRDAVTQFDESGIIVAAANPALLDLLDRRQWKQLFWVRRAEVVVGMRFLVFGHGLYDALRAPFYCICGRAAAVIVDRSALEGDVAALCGHVDQALAARFAQDYYPRPRALLALPLLGIPGVTPESDCADYYDDQVQFRPPPSWLVTDSTRFASDFARDASSASARKAPVR